MVRLHSYLRLRQRFGFIVRIGNVGPYVLTVDIGDEFPQNFRFEDVEIVFRVGSRFPFGAESMLFVCPDVPPVADNFIGADVSWEGWVCGNCAVFGTVDMRCGYNSTVGRDRKASDYGCIQWVRKGQDVQPSMLVSGGCLD